MGLFTRYAMDALMKTSHPEVIRRQCWNLHPHRTPCTCLLYTSPSPRDCS